MLEAKTPDDIQNFLDSNRGIAVVDCYATWCGPCKVIKPYVYQMHETSKVPLISIDVDKAEKLAKQYKIEAMPTFLVIKGKWNNIIYKMIGGSQQNVEKAFAQASKHK